MNFLYPYWLYALLIIPVIAILGILTRRAKSSAWKSLIAPRLVRKLVIKTSSSRHWIAFSMKLIALACVIMALSRPYYGKNKIREKIQTRNILLAIDTSKSMLCEDISSNRITAAKSLALQMLEDFPTDRIGVLIFAGTSKVIAPLTIDHIAIQDTISQLDTSSIPLGGSNLSEAVILGTETLKKSEKNGNMMVILSDGEEHDSGIEEAIDVANKAGIKLVTIGVGSQSGGIIPSASEEDGKHRNNQGEVVHTKLQENLLRELARETGGSYTSINNRPDIVIASAINSMQSFEELGRLQIIPQERYYLFLIPAVILSFLSALIGASLKTKNIAILLVLTLFIFLPNQTQAEESWLSKQKNTWFNSKAEEKRGLQALDKKNYKEAIRSLSNARMHSSGDKHAQLSSLIGEALYRDNQFSAAQKAFSDALLSTKPNLQADAEYNLGNSIFKNQISQFKNLGDTSLKDYLMEELQKPPNEAQMTIEDLDKYEESFANAKAKFLSSDKMRKSSKSKRNASISQQNIETIQEVRKAIQEQKKREDQQKSKDNKNKDNKDKDKKDGDQKDSDQQEGDQQEGDQQEGDQQEGDQKDGDQKDGDQKDGDQKDGDQKDGDQKDGDQKDGDQKDGEGRPGQDKSSLESANANRNEVKYGYAMEDQKEARELLEKNADMQQRPTDYKRKGWQIFNPEIDW